MMSLDRTAVSVVQQVLRAFWEWFASRAGGFFRVLVALTLGLVIFPGGVASESRTAEPQKYVPTPEQLRKGYQRAGGRARSRGRIYKARVTPHWFAGNTRFWYRNDLPGGTKEFILVDAEAGTRQPAFDHKKLAAALSKAAGKTYAADRLPFDSIEFVDTSKAVRFEVGDATWECDLSSYKCSRSGRGPVSRAVGPVRSEDVPDDSEALARTESLSPADRPPEPEDGKVRQRPRPVQPRPVRSPDGKRTAFIKEDNVWVRERGGKEVQLSKDGTQQNSYGMLEWAPDSKALVAWRIEPGETKQVHLIRSSPAGGGRATLWSRPYALPGDRFTAYELNLFDIAKSKQIKPAVERTDLGRPRLRWRKDGHTFTYEKHDRGHQRYRLIEVDTHTASVRNLIDEKAKTFIWSAHTESVDRSVTSLTWLQKTDELIYPSERDGWRHLYLIDFPKGKLKHQITRGEFVVRGIDRIDEDKRQVWFRASGKNPGQDPYFIHYYRVNFDGSGLTALTEGNGTHSGRYSPDGKYLIDTYSRVDLAPVTELRRTSDGKRVCQLEEADIRELKAGGWEPPEVFVTKGRDGKTDIWGIVCRPSNFDPNKKYPVVENIYAGPQGSFVPKSFIAGQLYSNLTGLGFIVAKIDGMGTANRSKAFHDVCWKNLKDAGLPDRIRWHQAVAKKYPWYDITRVGIYGGSAGGQNALGALLFHPDFYKVGVAGCGCHDNRMDKASWNEQWMGYPVGPQYAACSNVDNAHRLRGKLLLIVGELDTNVPPESTLRVADALIRAGKDFDLVVVPNAGHGMGGAYGMRRLQDFFVRHLHGVKPPERNAAPPPAAPARVGPAAAATEAKVPPVTVPPEAFFAKFADRDRDAARRFYKKHLDVKGVSVAAAAEGADEALQRTYVLVTRMLAGRPDILKVMARHGTRLIIIGKDQVYTDMPEYRNSVNATYLNERVRGTGGLGVTSFGEENLLNLPLDRYDDESIAVHEFCHTIDAALRKIDPRWRQRLGETYRQAMKEGLWKNTYAATNQAEYWAELCQSYFDCNRVNNWNHGPIGTREQLKQYDSRGYELVRDIFQLTPETDWRYRPLRRQPSVMAPPARFKIHPYYTKFTYAREFPVLGSEHVSDEALLRANDTIRKMFAYRHDILKVMITDGARLVVLGRKEKLSDLPEFKGARKKAGFDEVRYLDYAADRKLMVVPEENLLGLPGDPLAGRGMVISVFARGLHRVCALRPVIADFDRRRDRQQYELRVKRLDIEFDRKLRKAHEAARDKGLWKGTPAGRDPVEYWVAGVEAYFDSAGDSVAPSLADRPITTREALKAYDQALYELVDETMAYRERVDWRYRRPAPRE
jgi:dipeptidyl aminopeptidase/acylaminoacyl peptidase